MYRRVLSALLLALACSWAASCGTRRDGDLSRDSELLVELGAPSQGVPSGAYVLELFDAQAEHRLFSDYQVEIVPEGFLIKGGQGDAKRLLVFLKLVAPDGAELAESKGIVEFVPGRRASFGLTVRACSESCGPLQTCQDKGECVPVPTLAVVASES